MKTKAELIEEYKNKPLEIGQKIYVKGFKYCRNPNDFAIDYD